MKKKCFCLGLILSFVFISETVAETQTSGYCGPKDNQGNYATNCQWNYDSGTVTISGEGEVYDSTSFDFPWRTEIFESIENVVVEEGITSIGSHAFYMAKNLKNISLPASLTHIGWNAFKRSQLTSVVIPPLVKGISGSTTYPPFDSSITSVYCMSSQNQICKKALSDSSLNENILKIYDVKGGIYAFTDEDGNTFYYSSLSDFQQKRICDDKILCQATYMASEGKFCNTIQSCEKLVKADDNGQIIIINGKFYASLSDLYAGNYIPKRIYTIDEANRVAGKSNIFSIRYR